MMNWWHSLAGPAAEEGGEKKGMGSGRLLEHWWDVTTVPEQSLRASAARRGGMLACKEWQCSSVAVAP